MSRMFCTLKEAAETLNASEDQIQTLLERGILHEFREGPHRLLKEADIGALALVRERRSPAPPAASSTGARRPSTSPRIQPKTSRSAATIARPPGSPPGAGGRRTENRRQRTEDRGQHHPRESVLRDTSSVPGRSSGAPRRYGSAPAEAPARPAFPTPSRPSVRQWFWMGLVQDRPLVIALLSSLILLMLSALAAGLCFMAETWG